MADKKLNVMWFPSTMPAEDKETLETLIRNSRSVMDRLTVVIDREISHLQSHTPDDYETPAWACKQADRIGQIRALNKIRKMTVLT